MNRLTSTAKPLLLLILMTTLLMGTSPYMAKASFTPPPTPIANSQSKEGIALSQLLGLVDYAQSCSSKERYRKDGLLVDGEPMNLLFDVWRNCSGTKPMYLVITAKTLNPSTDIESALFFKIPLDNEVNRSQMLEIMSTAIGAPVADAIQVGPEPTVTPSISLFNLPTATPQNAQVTVTIRSSTLNVRSGPGTGYAILDSLRQGEQHSAVGRNQDCSWVQIRQSNGQSGCVASTGGFSTVNGDCNRLPTVATSALPTQPPSANSCIYFESHINRELTVTLTGQDRDWNNDFKIAPRGTYTECLDPGRYTYTISAPGIGSINGEIDMERGKSIRVPITG